MKEENPSTPSSGHPVAEDARSILAGFSANHFDSRDPRIKRAEFNQSRSKLLEELEAKFGLVCQLRLIPRCGQSGVFNVDHLVPLSTNELNKRLRGFRALRGRKVLSESLGSNHSDNLVIACAECNAFKKHRLVKRSGDRWVLCEFDQSA